MFEMSDYFHFLGLFFIYPIVKIIENQGDIKKEVTNQTAGGLI